MLDKVEVFLDKNAIEQIKTRMSKDLELASKIDHKRVDHSTYQVLLTLRALHGYFEELLIKPQFEIVTEEFERVGRENKQTEL